MLQTVSCRMDLAAQHGADVAIFLNNIVYWTLKNKAEKRHFHNGRYWTYGTISGFAALYPLWSESQIKRIIAKCRECGVLLVGEYNEDARDRTKWYSPSDEILRLYDDGVTELCIVRNRKMQSPNSSAPLDEIGNSNNVQEAIQEANTPIPPTRKGEPPVEVTNRVEEYAGKDSALLDAIYGLLENRRALRKPVVTLRALDGILVELDKHSGGDRVLKLLLLQKATTNNWLTIYALKADELPSAPATRPGLEDGELDAL